MLFKTATRPPRDPRPSASWAAVRRSSARRSAAALAGGTPQSPHLADFLSVDGFMGHRVGASPSSARLEVLSRAHQGSRSDSSAISASSHGSISTFTIAARIFGAWLQRPPPRSNREVSTCPVPSAVIPVSLSTLTRRSGIVCVRHHVPAIDRAARQRCLPVSPAVTAPRGGSEQVRTDIRRLCPPSDATGSCASPRPLRATKTGSPVPRGPSGSCGS